MNNIIRINSITAIHQLIGLPAPKHPLISIYDDCNIQIEEQYIGQRFTSDMYLIIFKDSISGSLGYGRNAYDFQNGTLIFLAPNQVLDVPTKEIIEKSKGWTLIFHPDLIRKSHLGTTIDEYSFFSYEVSEALHVSDVEQQHITTVAHQIRNEYSQNMDKHTQRLVISNLELLLNYCTRFYDRQFYVRSNFNKDFVSQFEHLLKDYFNTNKPTLLGIPTVSYFGQALQMSSNYLSDLLKKETGKSVKSHINEMIIKKTKTALLNSSSPVSSIAYDLGFEYPQSLSRLFKSKTGITPLAYRNLN